MSFSEKRGTELGHHHRPHLLVEVAPGGQQGRVADAAVGLAEGPLEQAGFDQAVDELGQAPAGDDQRLGEVPHLHPLLRGVGERAQHLVPGKRREVGGGEGFLDPAGDRGVRLDQRDPGLLVRVALDLVRGSGRGCRLVAHPVDCVR